MQHVTQRTLHFRLLVSEQHVAARAAHCRPVTDLEAKLRRDTPALNNFPTRVPGPGVGLGPARGRGRGRGSES